MPSSVLSDAEWVRARVPELAPGADAVFTARFLEHFPTLHRLFGELYGSEPAVREAMLAVVKLAATSWGARPADLRALDAAREAGLQTRLIDRLDDYPQPREGEAAHGHARVASFADIALPD